MGRVILRGRARPVDIFEPVPDMPASDLDHFRSIFDRLSAGEDGALEAIESLARANPDDAALGNLVYRLRNGDAEGCYGLD
jgi:adenylate cyclase